MSSYEGMDVLYFYYVHGLLTQNHINITGMQFVVQTVSLIY